MTEPTAETTVSDPSNYDFDGIGYVTSSSYRQSILECLGDQPKTPVQIAEACEYSITHVSRSLGELREQGFVDLLVPEDRSKGRYYGVTDRGQEVLLALRELEYDQ